jgi:NADPH:quinone reductase-like Zn-dependent oxidoreductase
VGDEVFGASKLLMGAYAEYLALPDHYTVAPKPANVSFEAAATVPLGGLNALHFLRLAKIQTGEAVLVNGAGGSIGTYAVQIAKTMGAEVTAVDGDLKKEMLLGLGADHFIDYRQQDFRQTKTRYDVIFDMLASSPLDETVAMLNPGGRYITANPTFKKIMRAKRVQKNTGRTVICAFAGETLEELLTLKQMIEDEKINPTVDRVFSMEQAAEAHRRVEAEQRLGCTVISMAL